jgi:ATP-binding protein involved in chromosome partitioning
MPVGFRGRNSIVTRPLYVPLKLLSNDMAFTRDEILEALSHVEEPDLGEDLVTLDMVEDITIEEGAVSFTVMLTTPACPLKDHIRQACTKAIHHMVSDDLEVQVNMDSDVTSRKDNSSRTGASREEGDLLPDVRNTIAVASGKGGVGKSTVAVNLAISLAQSGADVGLVDTDIYGPSVPTMMGAEGERPRVNADKEIEPLEKHGVRLLSMGFMVDPTDAVVWRGPMVSSAVKQFLGDAQWGDLDYLVLDLPPGTGDIQLTIVQTISLTGAIIVSTPQDVALADARKGVAMFEKVNVPVLGMVENMAYFSPPDMPERKYYLFGEGGARRLAEELQVPYLGEIPIEQKVREGSDTGRPIVVEHPETRSAQAFRTMAERTAQQVSIRNAELPPTQKVEILYQ